MAGSHCADCGGRILLGPGSELAPKLVCMECDVELEVNSIDLPEVDRAYDPDREEEGASVQGAAPGDLQVGQAEGMRGRLDLQSLSGSMPWR